MRLRQGGSRLATALALGPLLTASLVQAVFPDQVGQIDFHYQLLGLPQASTTFFHRPRQDDKASLLYTLSDVGVLGALNPSNGGLVWRQLLTPDNETEVVGANVPDAGRLVSIEGEGWLAAGQGASVHAWNAFSGRNIWWSDAAGEVVDLAVLPGSSSGGKTAKATSSVLALSRSDEPGVSAAVRRLSGSSGRVEWEHRLAASSSSSGQDPRYVRATRGKVYVVSVQPGHGLHVLVLDVQTGNRIEEVAVSSKGDELHATKDLLHVSSGETPVAIWTDRTRAKVRFNLLGTRQKHEFALPDQTSEVIVHARSSHLLVQTRTRVGSDLRHSGQVFHVDASAKTVQKTYDLPEAAGAGAFAVSGDAQGETVYFTRVTDDEVVLTGSNPSETVLGRWPLQKTAGAIHAVDAAAAEVVTKSGGDSYAVRVAVRTSDDDWVLVLNGELAWTRAEGLSDAVAVAFADRPEQEQLVKALEQEAHSNPWAAYVHRVQRHLDELERLPAYLQTLPSRILQSIFGAESLGEKAQTGEEETDDDDAFGFHQLVILATRRGRLYGLDAAAPGTIRWTTQAVDVGEGGVWDVQSIHVDEAQGIATVFAHTARQSVTVDIKTGQPAGGPMEELLHAVAGEAVIASTALVHSAAGAWVLPVSKDGQVAGGGAIPVDKCPEETIVVHRGNVLQGVRFVVVDGQKCVEENTWTFSAPSGARIVDVATRPIHDPVASIGRVLGDRRVLYKYLNPNVAVVATVDDASATLTTFLLDTVSGQVLSAATYEGVDSSSQDNDVECLLFENTFLCTFFADYRLDVDPHTGHQQAIKGYHLAVSDLYESLSPDERLTAEVSNTSSSLGPLPVNADFPLLPAVVTQTWIVAAPLRHLAVSSTRQGITTRQVLAYLPWTHGILGLPRIGAVLDARRPVGRDPTPAEAEEGLARYAPALEIDPRAVVSHERDVLGVRRIATAATHVESTSLVLAYGAVDVFGTRVAPSLPFDLLDRGFGKVSMLGTVVALAVGVAVLRPMVTKKQINLRWTAPL